MDIRMTSDGDRRTAVIEWSASAEDPLAAIQGAVLRGRLEAALRLLGQPDSAGGYASEHAAEAASALRGAALVAHALERGVDALMLAMRDTHRYGWGSIADDADMPRESAKRRILRARSRSTDVGRWFDADGVHHGDQDAAMAAEAAAELRDR